MRGYVDEIMLSRESTSIPVEPQLFGRDEEKNRLKGMLLQTHDDGRKHVHFISIVGTGGVGKTCLAQDVYNDPTITDHFKLIRAWVCVSKEFDVKRLVKEIIESASIPQPNDFQNLKNLNRIAGILKEGLMGKRFLIILDDIWDEPPENWEVLLSILNSGLAGSRVIITTRNQNLADKMMAESITLAGLRGDEYWELFVKYALGGKSLNEYPALEIVGKELVEKLRGNPLAAKTIGSVLNLKLEVGHWRGILHSNLCEVGQTNGKFMSVLKLSYDYLPGHLKPCFVYCSLFPQDYMYHEDELVQLWIAQGFVQPQESKTMEEIGKGYLSELLSRCFFQKTFHSRYVIHDLLHELAEYLFEGELLRLEDYKPEMKLPERVRHAYIHPYNLSLLCNNEYAKKYLRSLVICSGSNVSLDILRELKGIRVLIMHDPDAELSPISLGQILHLRYLETSKQNYWRLPESITKLYHLQVLKVWRDEPSFPQGTNKLICLRHLIPNDLNIAGVGRMTSLQELGLRIRKYEQGHNIGQLRDMLQLRSLKISGLESVENIEEASTAELGNKTNLKILELVWKEETDQHVANSEGVLEGLKPHQNLKDLEISNYGGRSTPSWLNGNWLSNLTSISLYRCPNWDILPPALGQILSLRSLKLYRMGAVRKIGMEFYGSPSSGVAFPSLESLFLEYMPELEEWCINVEGLRLFPRLSYLEVDQCPKLRGPLYVPSPLTSLSVRIISSSMEEFPYEKNAGRGRMRVTCPTITMLTEWIPRHNLASVEEMIIRNCEETMELDQTTLPTEVAEWSQHLTSLKGLGILDCRNLQSVPSLPMSRSLRSLTVECCPAIWRLPEEGLPSSLMELLIYRCPLLEGRCRKDGRDWHKVAHIPNITIGWKVDQGEDK